MKDKNVFGRGITMLITAIFLVACCVMPAGAGGDLAGAEEGVSIPNIFMSDDINDPDVVVPAAFDIIAADAFQGNTSVQSVEIQSASTEIPDAVFKGCTGLKSITLADGMTGIPEEAFSGCTALESIVLPATVKRIEASAFKGCTSLTGIIIPEGLTSIGDQAFQDTTALRSIQLPASLVHAGSDAFSGSGLERVIFGGTEEVYDTALAAEIGADVAVSFPNDSSVWDPNEDDGWIRVTYKNEDGKWVATLAVTPKKNCTLAVGGDQLGKTPGFTVRGLQTAASAPKDKETALFQLALSGKSGDKIQVKLTGTADSAVRARTDISKTIELTIPWSPLSDPDWIQISNMTPKSGETVRIRAVCSEGAMSFVLKAEPLAGSASFIQEKPAYGSPITLSPARPEETIVASVQGNKGDQIKLSVSGSYSAGGSDEHFQMEAGNLVISQSAPSPTTTPAPTPTPSAEPSSTPVPSQTPSASPTAEPTPAASPSAEPTPAASPSAEPTPAASPSTQPVPSASDAAPEPTPEPTYYIELKKDSGMELGEDLYGRGVIFVDDHTRAVTIENAFEHGANVFMEVESADGKPMDRGHIVGTGCRVYFRSTATMQPVRELAVVVWGDVMGTGKINLTQLVNAAWGYTKVKPLTGYYLMAIDFNRNFDINLSDLVREAALFRTRSDSALQGQRADMQAAVPSASAADRIV